MADAYVYDAVRTPRGRGKKDGSLHRGARRASRPPRCWRPVRDRNGLGHVHGRRHHLRLRRSGRRGRLGDPALGRLRGALRNNKAPGLQISRFLRELASMPSNLAAAKIAGGSDEIVIAGGVESIEPRRQWAMSGGALVHGSVRGPALLFHAAGHLGRPDRHQIRLFRATTWMPMP